MYGPNLGQYAGRLPRSRAAAVSGRRAGAGPELSVVSAPFALALPPAMECPSCLAELSGVGDALARALVDTPGRRLACAGALGPCRRTLAWRAGRLYRALASCTASYRARSVPDRARLAACRRVAEASYGPARVGEAACGTCRAADVEAIAAEVRSLVDGFTGAWFCGR